MSNSYIEHAGQSNAHPGGAWLELLISGLVVYIVAAGAGLVFLIFPEATRQVFGNIKQSLMQYAPQSSRPRVPVIEPPVVAEKAAVRKPVPRPVHVRRAPMPAHGKFGVQIIDATQPEAAVRTSPAVTVSVDNGQPARPANTPAPPVKPSK